MMQPCLWCGELAFEQYADCFCLWDCMRSWGWDKELYSVRVVLRKVRPTMTEIEIDRLVKVICV